MYTTDKTIAVTTMASGLDALERVHISRSLFMPAPTIMSIICIHMIAGAHSSLRVAGSPCASINKYAAKSHEMVKNREKHRYTMVRACHFDAAPGWWRPGGEHDASKRRKKGKTFNVESGSNANSGSETDAPSGFANASSIGDRDAATAPFETMSSAYIWRDTPCLRRSANVVRTVASKARI